MIFLKRRALMTRASFNYKTMNGIGSITLENCVETRFKRLELLGSSAQGENPSIESPKEIKNSGKYDETSGKYLINVGVTGKNLIDVDELRNENGYLKSRFTSSTKIKPFHIEKDKKYLLFGVGRGCDYSSVYFGDSSLKYAVNNYDWLHTVTGFKIFDSDKEKYIALTAKRSATITNVIIHGSNEVIDCYTVNKFGLFELMDGETSVQYEPYHEPQTVRLELNEPLRGIGQYKDDITKDGVLRNIKEDVLNGSEAWKIHPKKTKENTQAFGLARKIHRDVRMVLSDKFAYLRDGYFKDEPNISEYGGTDIWINIEKTKASTVEEFKAWLSQNPVTVQYVLKESVTEQFENSLDSLHANDGTTVISVDSGEVETGIEVEYAVKE